MRILIVVAALQTLAIFFFGFRVMEIDARTVDIAQTHSTLAAQASRQDISTPAAAISDGDDANRDLTADDVRKIFREELSAVAPLNAQQRNAANAMANDRQATTPAAETSGRKAALLYDLDRYVSQGSMSEVEMADFQTRISKLPPEQRAEMITKLTKALNSGKLDAQL